MKIRMNGSEWFATRAGGLNRYFDSLYGALLQQQDVQVEALAFGVPPADGGTWGPVGKSTLSRVVRSRARQPHAATDIIDTHFALYGSRFARSPKGAVRVHHFQGPWAAESAVAGAGWLSQQMKYAVERFIYSRVDHFIVLSNRFAELLSSTYRIDPEKISVIPPGVDLDRFNSVDLISQPAQHRAVCVRRLERRMGIDVLLRAWSQVIVQTPDAVLEIVGSGTCEDKLKDLAVAMRLGTSVIFSGRLSDAKLREAYARASVSVVPSLALEGFGLIALESLAAGTPTIVTDCGGLPDAVSGLDSSLIVPRNDADALSRRITLALSGERPSREECIEHAKLFSWERAAQTHLNLYRILISRPRVSGRRSSRGFGRAPHS